MKRKAILIEASNVAGLTDLPGARIDIENWQSFLKSDLGGAWADSEIITLRKPTSSDVNSALKVDSDCYCFVAFSGHGSDGSVVLNEAWISGGYSIASLKPKSDKGSLIIDACRGVEKAERYSFQRKVTIANESQQVVTAKNALEGRLTMFASKDAINNRALHILNHRDRWEAALNCSGKGVVEMLACAKGQGAGEDATAGGYYTSLLLQSAELWQQTTTFNKVHTTKDAHDYAATMLPSQQTPEYRPSSLTFPFGVKE